MKFGWQDYWLYSIAVCQKSDWTVKMRKIFLLNVKYYNYGFSKSN